jgi:hypothetical protein
LQLLFDPINPDKDTVPGRLFTRREKLDNEFWLLQRLEKIMERANFHELERSQVHKILQEHDSEHGVRVSGSKELNIIKKTRSESKLEFPNVVVCWLSLTLL